MAGGGGKVMWFGCLVCWLLGGFVACVALSLGRRAVDTWMDGWMMCPWGGRSAFPARQTNPPPRRISSIESTALGENTELCCLVAWFVRCLLGSLAWPRCFFVGWSVGGHSVGGWIVEASGSVSGGSRRSG